MTTFDGAVQAWILAHQYPLAHGFFLWVTIAGGITSMKVLAAAGAAWLWVRGRRVGAALVLLAPVLAIPLFNILKQVYARPRPLGLGGAAETDYSFPSGHATASAAVCCTLAYIFWREGLVGGRWALAFAVLIPLIVGTSRLYLNVHWTIDVLGGWSAGLCVAGLSAVLHDRYRRRRDGDRASPHSSAVPTS